MKLKLRRKHLNTIHASLLITQVTARKDMMDLVRNEPNLIPEGLAHKAIVWYNEVSEAIDKLWPYLQEEE